jgi:ubiquitin C-terminal hydrolase
MTWRTVGLLALRGLVNAGQTCYASCVIQVLLRVPAVALWLRTHANHRAGRSGDGADARCPVCVLWATRLQLGSKTMPELVRHRGAIDSRFDERGQHDAAEFLRLLLDRMRATEWHAGRATEWFGVGSEEAWVTHVDRLFCFVSESRLQCKVCKSGSARHAPARMLVLPVPPADPQVRFWTVTDLYYLWAKPEELVGDDARVYETCNGQLTSHV